MAIIIIIIEYTRSKRVLTSLYDVLYALCFRNKIVIDYRDSNRSRSGGFFQDHRPQTSGSRGHDDLYHLKQPHHHQPPGVNSTGTKVFILACMPQALTRLARLSVANQGADVDTNRDRRAKIGPRASSTRTNRTLHTHRLCQLFVRSPRGQRVCLV